MLRPVATHQQAMILLQTLGVRGEITEFDLSTLLKSSLIRKLKRKTTGMAKALKDALCMMQMEGEVIIIEPVHGSRNKWGSRGGCGESALGVVITRMTRWISGRVIRGIRTTAAQTRANYRKQYKAAGGLSSVLTKEINSLLLSHAMQGNLVLDNSANGVISLFSGGQSSDAPLREVGLSPTHIDVCQKYLFRRDIAGKEYVTVRVSTDLTSAPLGRMIPWIQGRESLTPNLTSLVLAGIPCHTWSNMNNTLRASGNEYRDKEGNATSKLGPKRDEAIIQTALAKNTVDSIVAWVQKGAIHGWQRHFIIENPAYGTLRLQPFMKLLPVQKVAHYCMYNTTMDSSEFYPSNKPTAIWSNIKGWKPRVCTRSGRHAPHEATIGGNNKKRPGVTNSMEGFTPWAAKRWTPQGLIQEILLYRKH